tara:strand:+ start:39 stop:848 length:810 start_codon:yes stop_codon:yes gene_type:complete
MKKYLVIGNPIDHSLSPLIHNYWIKKYNLSESFYDKKKIEEKDLKNIVLQMRDNLIHGVNVTVPFKKSIISYLDELDITAKKTESVNTLVKINDKIVGHNTDEPGFGLTIQSFFSKSNNQYKNVFILGAGGVTTSIISALKKFKTKIFLSNRTIKKANDLNEKYPEVEILDWGKRPQTFDIIINTTSIGLRDDEKIDLDFSDCEGDKEKIFYDLIYNPKETNFLKEAKIRGNLTMNGKNMLLNQAMLAFNLWTNIKPEINKEIGELLDK